MQGQKKLSFSALALSVWTAALAESLEPGVSPARDASLWRARGTVADRDQRGAVRLLAADGGAAGLAFCGGPRASGRGVQDGNAGAECLSAGVSFHGNARPAPAAALGGMPHSTFRLGCPGKGAVVVRAAGGGALSGRHCRPDGVVPSAGTGCSAAGPAAACTAVRRSICSGPF